MKLKKIASLMLAGIMAVSMLAGCEGKSDNNEEKNPVVPVTSDIVTWANDALDGKAKGVFKFESDAKVDEALKAVATDSTKYGSADIAAAMSNMTFAGAYDEDLSDELMDKLEADYISLVGSTHGVAAANFDKQCEGSSAGMTAAKGDTVGNVIGMSSAELSDADAAELTNFNVALDAIAVIVNKDNDQISNITIEQLFDIYTGAITKFSQLDAE